jgi:hypothetical protein
MLPPYATIFFSFIISFHNIPRTAVRPGLATTDTPDNTNRINAQASVLRVGLEPTISVFEWVKPLGHSDRR